MRADPTSKLIWLLLWSVMIVVYLMGNYCLKLERDRDRLHAEVSASMLPPDVVIFRGPLTAERSAQDSSRQGATETNSK
jgi:hypothetical protein